MWGFGERTVSAFLSLGFRPFFLGAAVWSCLAMGLWLAQLQGLVAPGASFTPGAWHAHEMLFGFAAAVIAGFALTAVPQWTGQTPLGGGALAALFGLWLAGRAGMVVPGLIGLPAVGVLDSAFLAALTLVVAHAILRAGNRRNLVVALAFTILFAANAAFHAAGPDGPELQSLALRLGLAGIVALITLIGGRITPAFTGNWLRRTGREGQPAPIGWIDGAALGIGVLALGVWVVLPEGAVTAGLLLLAAGLHALRLARWCGFKTGSEPLVWILHLGYAWVPIGLAALGLGPWIAGLSGSAGLHALSVGAVGTMTLAVMSRATLGHTGRPLTAGTGTLTVYCLVTLAAGLRIGAAWAGGMEAEMMLASGVCWTASFGLFAGLYGPMFLAPALPGSASADG
jgi:uncharacterized protein involved in response to NO